MPQTITKIVFRRGLRTTGKSVILNEGEPGWYTDTKRLYVGDGSTSGGNVIGNKNYGFKNFSTLNFNTLSGAELGDLVYDEVSNQLFFLSGNNGALQQSWGAVDFIVKVDDSSVEFNTSSALQIKNYGVQPIHINSNIVGNGLIGGAGTSIKVNPDNNTIEIDSNALRLKPGSVSVSYLGSISPFTILGNVNSFSAPIQNIAMSNGKVIGMFSNTLGPLDFSTIVQYGGGIGTLNTSNGITGSISLGTPSTINIGYDSDLIDVTDNDVIKLKRKVTISNVGVAPLALDVGGNIGASGFLRAGGDIIAFYSSDKNLKTNIKKLENNLNKLDSIEGVEFDWQPNHYLEGHDVGLIAQQVQEVLPEAVSKRDDGYLGVNYIKLIPFLVNCIKELKEELKVLKNEK